MPFVIVDDHDAGISVNPTGVPGGYAGFSDTVFTASFAGTLSGTAVSVTTIEYSFNGINAL